MIGLTTVCVRGRYIYLLITLLFCGMVLLWITKVLLNLLLFDITTDFLHLLLNIG